MVRVARVVFPGVPHHITQRGNRRAQVFFSDDDRRDYCDWLHFYSRKYGVQILAYCLMGNHVHLVAVPQTASALEQVLRPVHTHHAQRINAANGWSGHLWQGRYFSAALDESWLWCAIRYVERNPVRAGMVARAEDYTWSSAPAHCAQHPDPLLTADPNWAEQIAMVSDWRGWLAEAEAQTQLDIIRKHTLNRWPCGSDEFVAKLEHKAGVQLGPRKIGRPKK